jgi:hypothetical protein
MVDSTLLQTCEAERHTFPVGQGEWKEYWFCHGPQHQTHTSEQGSVRHPQTESLGLLQHHGSKLISLASEFKPASQSKSSSHSSRHILEPSPRLQADAYWPRLQVHSSARLTFIDPAPGQNPCPRLTSMDRGLSNTRLAPVAPSSTKACAQVHCIRLRGQDHLSRTWN